MSHAPARAADQRAGSAVVVVFDGPWCPIGTWSERYRHWCEARRILRLDEWEREAWLSAIEKKRGSAARQALEKSINRLKRAGHK